MLLSVYNVLVWMVRDQGDLLCLAPTHFVWSKQGTRVGRFRIDGVRPRMSFREALQTFLARDPVVQRHLQLVAESPQELTYRLQNVPTAHVAA